MKDPVFLIGTQRSGTTLLTRMLTAHKDIFIKNEGPMLSIFTPGVTPSEVVERIDAAVKERHGSSISDLLQQEGKSIWGFKDPQLTEYLDVLAQFVPNVKFIIITRDPRAVVRSYIENAWGLGTNCYTGALRWADEVAQQLAFEKRFPDHTLRMKYEDLVTNQKECLERICEFLEVEFDPDMLDYSNKKAFVQVNRQSINTFKAPDKSIADKWKTELSPHQIKVVNTVCKDIIAKTGYEISDVYNNDVPNGLKRYYQIHQKIIGEIQIQYRWRIGGYIRRYKAWRTER